MRDFSRSSLLSVVFVFMTYAELRRPITALLMQNEELKTSVIQSSQPAE